MRQKFSATLKKQKGLDSFYIEIPFDVKTVFGSNRVKVKAWFDGVFCRGSVVKMGMPVHIIGLNKEIRQKLGGKQEEDIISVEIEKDEEERIIELPDDFKVALEKQTEAKNYFKNLSYSRKREYLKWIESSKKAETRRGRIERAVVMLIENKNLNE